jgi:hypothetical protein
VHVSTHAVGGVPVRISPANGVARVDMSSIPRITMRFAKSRRSRNKVRASRTPLEPQAPPKPAEVTSAIQVALSAVARHGEAAYDRGRHRISIATE